MSIQYPMVLMELPCGCVVIPVPAVRDGHYFHVFCRRAPEYASAGASVMVSPFRLDRYDRPVPAVPGFECRCPGG